MHMRMRNLLPWPQLTRQGGIPPMRVIRKPLSLAGQTLSPGTPLGSYVCSANRVKLRQLYEQRAIEPIAAPAGTVQAHKERMLRTGQMQSAKPVTPVSGRKRGHTPPTLPTPPALSPPAVVVDSMPEPKGTNNNKQRVSASSYTPVRARSRKKG